MDPSTIESLPLKRNRSSGSDDEDNEMEECGIKKSCQDKKNDETLADSDIKVGMSSEEEFDLVEYLKDQEDDYAENSDKSDDDSDEDDSEPDDSEYSDDE